MSEKEPPEVSVGGGLDQKSANYGLNAKCGPWPVSIKFCWHTAMPLISISPMVLSLPEYS